MDAPLSVLQVSAFFPAHGGGIEVVAGKVAEGLSASGMRVCWMAGGARQDVPHQLASDTLLLEWAPSVDFLERRMGLPLPAWRLQGVLRLWRNIAQADVVHVHDYLYLPSMCAVLFAWLRKKPVVLTQHIGDIVFRSLWKRLLLRGLNKTLGRAVLSSVQRVAFVGRPVKEYFGQFVKFSRPPVLIENGVDHALFHPGQKPAAEKLSFLFVGRFVEKKGVQHLRQCVDIAGVDWDFVGWGPLSPATWSETGERVRIHSDVRAAGIVPFYQKADLLVLPSTGEGFPLVLQEALACGTPVLVSEEVKAAFSRVDDACVFSVDMQQKHAASMLRKRLEALAASPQKLVAAREAACKLSGQWSWDACVEAYIMLYRESMQGR